MVKTSVLFEHFKVIVFVQNVLCVISQKSVFRQASEGCSEWRWFCFSVSYELHKRFAKICCFVYV